ncbi:MAG: magnesium transporter [Polyangiales bacterium]
MRLATLLGPDLKAALEQDPEALKEALQDFHEEDVAEILEGLEDEQALALMRILPADVAAAVLERLPTERRIEIFEDLDRDRAVEVFSEMSPDDRVDVVQELGEEAAEELISDLARSEPEVAHELRELAAYAPETAGGRMTTEYVALLPETKVWEAVEDVRRVGREGAEMLYYVYVLGFGKKLLGVLSLRDLILSEPGQTLADIMTEKVVTVGPLDDQEKVAQVIARYDLHAVPVVDDQHVLLGVVTVDDVVDVVIEEATEDAQLMGGVVPLEDSYFATSLPEFVWKRGAWLVLLFLGQMLTATVMENNRRMLESAVELVLFVPLIIASGGNAGSQSSSLLIRALAVGEVRPADWWKVLLRELGVGISLGIGLGLLGFVRAVLTGHEIEPLRLAGAVAASIVSVVTLASMVGSLLPMLIKRLGLDPAVSSTPFIASVTDVFGLVVYFQVARAVLDIAR